MMDEAWHQHGDPTSIMRRSIFRLGVHYLPKLSHLSLFHGCGFELES
jgi:hypothetical protein